MELTHPAFVQRVRDLGPQGTLTVAFDTNTIGGLWDGRLREFRRFDALCSTIARVNYALRPTAPVEARPLQICVSALVHAEVLHDLRQHFGPRFNPVLISKELANKGLAVAPVSKEHAEALAVRLGRRFPDGDRWRAHKLEIAASCLGIARRLDELGIVAPATSRCGATVDWLIGSHAVQQSAILVTNDRQIEFEDVPTLSRGALAAALDELLGSG